MKFRKNILIVLIILLYHQRAFAQSTYLPIPRSDVFLNIQSSSDYLSLLGIYISFALIMAGPIYSLLSFLIPLSRTKNRMDWGKVINSITGEPLKNTIVTLNIYSNSVTHKRKDRSNNNGYYGFNPIKGMFSLTAKNKYFKFPSKISGVYKGDKFVISDERDNPEIDISMDPIYNIETSMKAKLYYYGQRLGVPILIIFTLIAFYHALYFPSLTGIITLGIYASLWVILVLLISANLNKSVVVSKESKLPLINAKITIHDSEKNVVGKKMTNDMGQFELDLDPGSYSIMVSRPKFNSVSESIVIQRNKKFRLRVVLKGLDDKS